MYELKIVYFIILKVKYILSSKIEFDRIKKMAASQQDMLTGTRLSLRWNNHINTISEALSTFKNKVNLVKRY